ncbi:MAG: flagellar basal body rod protein FlgC [Kyrpidia sp.]|nr:flagellar basal body rod protein FlgC [Kyrpidia sp.]
MGWQDTFAISGSGLAAQRLRMDVIAGNIANADTTRRPDGTPGPYRRRMVVMEPQTGPGSFYGTLVSVGAGSSVPEGVRVSAVVEDPSPFQLRYDPSNPDAVQNPASPLYGYVQLPNVDVATEMVDLISASRAYEANITVLDAGKMMAVKALDIGRG